MVNPVLAAGMAPVRGTKYYVFKIKGQGHVATTMDFFVDSIYPELLKGFGTKLIQILIL